MAVNLDVGKYHFPINANIRAYDSANIQIASTSSTASITGGDSTQLTSDENDSVLRFG